MKAANRAIAGFHIRHTVAVAGLRGSTFTGSIHFPNSHFHFPLLCHLLLPPFRQPAAAFPGFARAAAFPQGPTWKNPTGTTISPSKKRVVANELITCSMHFNRFAVVHNRYEPVLSPAVAMLVANNGIKNAHTVIKGSGPKGRILKVCLFSTLRCSLRVSSSPQHRADLSLSLRSRMCWPS